MSYKWTKLDHSDFNNPDSRPWTKVQKRSSEQTERDYLKLDWLILCNFSYMWHTIQALFLRAHKAVEHYFRFFVHIRLFGLNKNYNRLSEFIQSNPFCIVCAKNYFEI